jgi:hypothetical protein
LLLLLFVSHYQLSIPRNVWLLVGGFGSYFILNAILLALRRYFGDQFIPTRNLVSPLLSLAAILGSLMISKAGEIETRPIRALWAARNREIENGLALQLRGFNSALIKVLRS